MNVSLYDHMDTLPSVLFFFKSTFLCIYTYISNIVFNLRHIDHFRATDCDILCRYLADNFRCSEQHNIDYCHIHFAVTLRKYMPKFA